MLRITSLAAMTPLLLANACFAGFYAGVSAGPESSRFSQKAHIIRPGTFEAFDKQHFAGSGVFGSVFAGYGKRFNKLYLAGEINANLSSVEYKLTNVEYVNNNYSKTTFTVRNSEGVGLLPGIFLADNFLAYGRVGYANGKIRMNQSDPTIQGSNSNKSGIRYGLGGRFYWFEHLALMMEYSQINYDHIFSLVYEPNGNVTKATKFSSSTSQVAFGLVYNFDGAKTDYKA